MFNQVFLVTYKNCYPNKGLNLFLQHWTSQDIIQFGIPVLPVRLQIEVLPYEWFSKKISQKNLPTPILQLCIAYSDSSIHCVDYSSLPIRMTHEDYFKTIRHECIHILQHLATRIPPNSAIWLYESIACALAKQCISKPVSAPSWLSFITNFYKIPDCYAIAFKFGTELLKCIPLKEVIKQCENLESFENECKKLYEEIFNQ